MPCRNSPPSFDLLASPPFSRLSSHQDTDSAPPRGDYESLEGNLRNRGYGLSGLDRVRPLRSGRLGQSKISGTPRKKDRSTESVLHRTAPSCSRDSTYLQIYRLVLCKTESTSIVQYFSHIIYVNSACARWNALIQQATISTPVVSNPIPSRRHNKAFSARMFVYSAPTRGVSGL